MKSNSPEVGLGAALLRQLEAAVSAGADLASAGRRLRDTLSPPMQARLDGLLSALESPDAGSTPTAHQSVMRRAKAAGADTLKATLRFTRHASALAVAQYRMSETVNQKTGMFYATAFVAVVVTATVLWWVVPFFLAIYGDTARLPAFTHFIYLTGGGVIAYLMMAALVASALLVMSFARDVRRAMGELRPMPGRWRKVPALRRVAERLDLFILVVVADCLRAGGVGTPAALEAAADASGQPLLAANRYRGDDTTAEALALAMARDGGTLDAELDWQAKNAVGILGTEFSAVMDQVESLLLGLAGVVVGVLVISIYLPIFRLGAVTF